MAWEGWLQFDGNEIINVTRTETYAENLQAHWLKPQYLNDSLPYMLGDGLEYKTPLLDDAPWLDGDNVDSLDFIGMYPLDIQGIESATREAQVFESIANGGAVRGVRHSTKSIVVSAVLCAVSEAGAEYGLRWLKQVLNGAPCGGGTDGVDCSGADLCYLASEPVMVLPEPGEGRAPVGPDAGYGEGGYGEGPFGDPWAPIGPYGADFGYGEGEYGEGLYGDPPALIPVFDPEDCLTPVMRTLRNVTVTSGPTVTAKRTLSDGSAVWTVSFTAVAGNPYEFGPTTPVIVGFLDPEVGFPWPTGTEAGHYDDQGYITEEAPCFEPIFSPVFDPLCPALIPPPAPPNIPLGCFTDPANWVRRQITIPKEHVPLWGDVLPTIEVHARKAEVRDLRIRLYADVDETGDPGNDPCAFCGDILISYVPANSSLVFDSVAQQIYVQRPGYNRRRADSLVFGTNSKPFEWPVLSCGMAYIFTLDTPQTQELPVIDISLTPRVI